MICPRRRYVVERSETWIATYEMEADDPEQAMQSCTAETEKERHRESWEYSPSTVSLLPPDGPAYPVEEYGQCKKIVSPHTCGGFYYVKGYDRYLYVNGNSISAKPFLSEENWWHREVLALMAWGDGMSVTPDGIACVLPLVAEILRGWQAEARARAAAVTDAPPASP